MPQTAVMIAILGGLGAAFMWAAANLASARSSRLIGASSALAWMMLVGLVVTAPLVPFAGPVPQLTPVLAFWLAASGLGSVIGLFFVYRGLRIGKVGPVLAIASTEGAIAAVVAVIAGERLTIPVALMLGVIAVGIAVVALATGDTAEASGAAGAAGEHGVSATAAASPVLRPGRSAERQATLFGTAGAIAFGFSIYGTAQAGLALPIIIAIMPARVAGVALVFVPMALAGRLRMTRRAVPLVVITALGEVLGNVAYVVGARESIAIAAVLACQYAAVGAVAAFFLFRERLSLLQRSGVVAIAVGVAILTAVRT
ncbi:MAG TPA: EamA family transporter [Terriglobales bacterium]|nr:EamA family transporter [Terriglobales bacterium]